MIHCYTVSFLAATVGLVTYIQIALYEHSMHSALRLELIFGKEMWCKQNTHFIVHIQFMCGFHVIKQTVVQDGAALKNVSRDVLFWSYEQSDQL